MAKYKKGSAWKRTHWDRWSFGRKVLHVLAVIAALATIAIMLLGAAYVVLVVFGLYGFSIHVRDTVLLNFGHWLFD